ncbi:putative membrane-spanning 4-domains subfamily A member 8-like [Scophthalmus maximus]|nr:B-lymphocyte antigen CD20 [Scophthalmus maximus]AWO96069.1 putative membrane-spanning 4-domains subfamily A member 8-like [Scophthalmus maximus]
MSVSMDKGDGVTVLTLTFDSQSSCPPLCQIFKSLCYSPVWCSVSQHIRSLHRTSQTVLGAMHIMVGLINIGLGVILLNSGSGSGWQMDETLFPVWMGILFIVFGIMCILSEKFPSPCLVSISVILNMAGVAFAVTAIVLYSINLANVDFWWLCEHDDYEYRNRRVAPLTQSPEESLIQEKCWRGQELTLMLVRSINAVLIVLSALELCVTISSVVLGIKALSSRKREDSEATCDPELHKPLLEEVTA